MRSRLLIFWLHLIVGVLTGIVILILAVTGVILSFERQIVSKADHYRIERPNSATSRESVEEILKQVRGITKNIPSTLTVGSGDNSPVVVGFGKDANYFFDPYTGAFLGKGSSGTRQFFQFVTELHRWLATGGNNRAIGKGITGAGCLLFLFLVLSGFYLWWPRNWGWRFIRQTTWFVRGLRGQARDWNWHNTVGFWCLPLLLVTTSTGVIMSYSWANNLIFTLTRTEPPAARKNARETQAAATFEATGLNNLMTVVKSNTPVWQTITARLPKSPESPVTFIIERGNGAHPDERSQITLERTSGKILKTEEFSSYNLGRQIRAWVKPIHTGEALGVIGQSLAALSALGASVLMVTGFLMAGRRFLRWRQNLRKT